MFEVTRKDKKETVEILQSICDKICAGSFLVAFFEKAPVYPLIIAFLFLVIVFVLHFTYREEENER